MKLTIAIPTYNRLDSLKLQIKRLIDQDVTTKCNVVVINNNPTQKIDFIPSNFRLIENKYNCGGSFNVINCFLYSESEYVWVLSDDDIIVPNAIDEIISDIEKGYDCIKYDDHFSENRKNGTINKIDNSISYINSSENISSFIFLSGWVFSTKYLNKSFRELVNSSNSYMPQVVYALLILKYDGTIFFSEFKLTTVSETENQIWPGSLVHNYMFEWVRTCSWLTEKFVINWRKYLFNEYRLKGYLGRHLRAKNEFGTHYKRIVYGKYSYKFFFYYLNNSLLYILNFILKDKLNKKHSNGSSGRL